MNELENFEEWIDGLELQTLTDELKQDIKDEARAAVLSILLRVSTDLKNITKDGTN